MSKRLKTRLLTIMLILSLIILFAVSLTAIFAAIAQDFSTIYNVSFDAPYQESEGLQYQLNEEGTGYVIIGGTIPADGILVVPAEYNGKPIVEITGGSIVKEPLYGDIDENETVNGAFANSGIKQVVIFGNEIEIGPLAFAGCDQLTDIIFLGDETADGKEIQIGDYAFRNCKSLTEIELPQNISKLSGASFAGCSSVESIKIDENNPYYYDQNNCLLEKDTKDLVLGCKTSEIPEDTKNILSSAFEGQTDLISLVIPDNIETMKDRVFANCSNLTSVKIGSNLKEVGQETFINCNNVIEVFVDDIEKYVTIDFNDRESNPTLYSRRLYAKVVDNFGNETYDLVTSVELKVATRIGVRAFLNLLDMQSIKFGPQVEEIAAHAFNSCELNMEILVIPDTIKKIGECAFNYCRGIQNVVISNTVPELGRRVFAECYNLESITIGNNVQTIEEEAFYLCGKLTNVSIPDSVKSIGKNAFKDCATLNTVNLGNSVETVGEDAFTGCTAMKKVNTNNVDNFAMINFESAFANPISQIEPYNEKYLYLNNELVVNLVLNNATKIGNYAFYGVYCIKSLKIGSNVKSIGGHAFNSCVNIEGELVIPNSVTEVKDHVFNYCPKITSVKIGDGLTNMETSMFQSCTGLKQVTIGSNVNTIMHYVFNGCTNLTSITIPSKVTTIGIMAFNGCGLTNVEMINPNNWYCSTDKINFSNSTKVVENLADNSVAANCLKTTYKDYILKQIN